MPDIGPTPGVIRRELSQVDWDHARFGLEEDDIHTTLFEEFNTFSGCIQNPEAFCHDVREISRKAKDIHDLRRMLYRRRRFRLLEMAEAADDILCYLTWQRSMHACEHVDRYDKALELATFKSLESTVQYLDSLLKVEYRNGFRRVIPEDPADYIAEKETPVQKQRSEPTPKCPTFITSRSEDRDSHSNERRAPMKPPRSPGLVKSKTKRKRLEDESQPCDSKRRKMLAEEKQQKSEALAENNSSPPDLSIASDSSTETDQGDQTQSRTLAAGDSPSDRNAERNARKEPVVKVNFVERPEVKHPPDFQSCSHDWDFAETDWLCSQAWDP